MTERITAASIRALKGNGKISMVTAYDYPGAIIANEGGVDAILVGDTAANVVHGMPTTLEFDIETMLVHAQAVRRAEGRALVVVDMPWLSYHLSPTDGVLNAGRLVREGGAQAVKLEGGAKRAAVVQRLVDAEIPVMGHIGLTPQSIRAMGGYKVQGRAVDDAVELVRDAKALEEAGCFALVVEAVPDVVGRLITDSLSIPTIGIGAGPYTDGQILVFHDLLGLGSDRVPRFVRQYAQLHSDAVNAVRRYVGDVSSGDFPSGSESYQLAPEVEWQISRLALESQRSDG